jgi:hypothetical protein
VSGLREYIIHHGESGVTIFEDSDVDTGQQRPDFPCSLFVRINLSLKSVSGTPVPCGPSPEFRVQKKAGVDKILIRKEVA